MINPGKVSIIIPAYNEAERIGATVDALIKLKLGDEVVVVDDGSKDKTAATALEHGATVVRKVKNRGKGAAMNAGLAVARGEFIVFLDADLGDSAGRAQPIIELVKEGDADLAVGAFSAPGGGFGLVRRLARLGVRLLGGPAMDAPLSGQRAMRREVLNAIYPLRRDFGVETEMLVRAARAGFSVVEAPVDMTHRPTGRSLRGFAHRARQGFGVSCALCSCALAAVSAAAGASRAFSLLKGLAERARGSVDNSDTTGEMPDYY